MNLEHAVQIIAKRGFTDRQARFLVLVARHSGVCVMRQYSTFAGIVFGQKTRKFFANLVRARLVSTYDCAHSRGRVYHLRHRAIYEAIGEPDSRLRRPPSVPRALERLMLLDAILENPDSIWMSSSAEKVDYLSSRGIAIENAPRLVIRHGVQQQAPYFPDRLPIGVHPSGHVVFVYLHSDPMRDEFRDFLQRHAPLLEKLPTWTIRIVVPARLESAAQDLLKVVWGQLASPLKDPILTELRWYFDHRAGGLAGLSEPADRCRFERCERAFATDRYTVLYRRWRQDGERVLTTASSPIVGQAMESGAAKIEPLVLPTPTAIWRRWREWRRHPVGTSRVLLSLVAQIEQNRDMATRQSRTGSVSAVARRSGRAHPVNARSGGPDAKLDALDRESDALLARMQAAKVRRAMKTAFQASGNKLGKAAVAALRTRGK